MKQTPTPEGLVRSVGRFVLGVGLALGLAVPAARLHAAPTLPGPLGGPQIATDVNTMIGRKAPPFTLRDGDGKTHNVVAGRGRSLVVISHMGFY